MSTSVEYRVNQATETEVADHLSHCDTNFIPRLSSRVEIDDYARKIVSKAMRFEAWAGKTLVGLVAAYCNDQEKRVAYVTNVSVMKAWTGKGIAVCLMNQCIEHSKLSGMQQISLEAGNDNTPALNLYKKSGFVADQANGLSVSMKLELGRVK